MEYSFHFLNNNNKESEASKVYCESEITAQYSFSLQNAKLCISRCIYFTDIL